ncbi:Fc receptor-like protein 2, partial [Xyrauchen texanus]|uniref:Fc receptor-like protein 2 n=1 Tax=Xyrauchen texanus TaxID=154827 RepID=UPI002242C3D6
MRAHSNLGCPTRAPPGPHSVGPTRAPHFTPTWAPKGFAVGPQLAPMGAHSTYSGPAHSQPTLWGVPLGPHLGPIVWCPHVPRISRRYLGPQWAARNGPIRAPMEHVCWVLAIWVIDAGLHDLPTAKLTVHPETSVFTGETVIMKCDIESDYSNWRYEWYKDRTVVSESERYTVNTNTLTIRGATESDQHQFCCRGKRDGRPATSQNTSVTLSVKDSKLNPELTSDTAGAALTGNTVTLICHMTQTTGWDFYWYKHTQNSEKNKTETNSYRVHIDSVSDGGQYWCRAGRGEPVYYTNYSDALWVSVTAQRPSVSLIISPSRSQHFSSHSLSLNCEDHNNSTGWTVRRNTDSERMKDCSSTGSTCEISSLKTSDTGVYWCESQSGEHSPHINITVHDGDVILESSVHPVIEGDTLTLHCLHRSTNSSILTADFYKDGSLLQKQTTGEMSIPTVSKSHEGFYSCKHGERGQSPESWISVTGES